MRYTFALLLTSLLLWSIVATVNHYLAPLHVYLFLGGLFVTFPALRLPPRAGLFVALLAGLLCDAGTPVTFGLQAFLFGLTAAVILYLRDRLAREEAVMQTIVAALANIGLLLALALTQTRGLPAPGATWLRLIWDLFWSLVALVLIAPWFFALQRRALGIADSVAAYFSQRRHD